MKGGPTPRAAEIFPESDADLGPREFEYLGDDAYRLSLDHLGTSFEIDRLRRKSDELIGELIVRCDLPGARTVEGVLSAGDFNLSSVRARQDRARHLTERSRAADVDWLALLEELCQRVLGAERDGSPAVSLRDLPRPAVDDTLEIDGLPLLARHPLILFGDGGAAKSYLGLFVAGRLVERGHRVALFDWELAGDDHRLRLESLFGADMPDVRYLRMDRPLAHAVDHVRRVVRQDRLDYAIFDSVAFACDGPPEAAEVAGRYFQALRQLGPLGSLHLAHISKADGADQKPFGSTFWHNGARSTWFIKRAESISEGRVSIGLFNRKANLGPVRPALGFDFTFSDDRTTIRRCEVADAPDLADHLSIRQRMVAVLRHGAMTPEAVADDVGAKLDTVRRTVRRYSQTFTLLPGGRLGLKERGPS